MMVFLPDGRPALGDCAAACRRMRSVGIPVTLEIIGSFQSAKEIKMTIPELVHELEDSFSANLTPVFQGSCNLHFNNPPTALGANGARQWTKTVSRGAIPAK
jgi:hypothetical protein